jgi:homoserine kinase type II
MGLLGEALRHVPPDDAPQDWRGPWRVHPAVPDVGDLCRELRAAGVSPDLVTPLETAATRVEAWRSQAGGELPVQVVHGDLGSSNLLTDERAITAVLDFEIAGADFRVQDLVAALLNSGVLDGPEWPRRTAALIRGHASVRRLTPAEIQAVPDLLLTRSVGSALWRAGRWRRGQAQLSDVTGRLRTLDARTRSLAASGRPILALLS